MSLLSDYGLRLAIAESHLALSPPLNDANLQPSSIDLHLSTHLIVMPESWVFDPKDPTTFLVGEEHTIPPGGCFLPPLGRLVLAATFEHVSLDLTLAGRVEGKSSLGRMGLPVHVTAGYIDPGFRGYITLELSTVGGLRSYLYPGMPIAQLAIERLSSTASSGYAGKYQDAPGPQRSAYYKNWDGTQWK